MKNLYYICLFVSIVFLGGCSVLDKDNNMFVGQDKEIANTKFDLNLNSLLYQLPAYTKICIPKTRYNCIVDGCVQDKPSVFVLYDEISNKVYRCDKNPCDGYEVSKEVSGFYTNLVAVTPNGSLVKYSEENEYVEMVSLGLDSIIYRGTCKEKNNF